MERTKIVVLATAIAVLATVVLAGVAFAQTNAPSQAPSTVATLSPYGGNFCGYNGYGCPGSNGYVNGAPQNGYTGQTSGYGRCGMMGGYYR
jgi:hypothetical protein